MGVDDHAQGAVEVAVLFRAQVVELLGGKGFIAGEESVPVALELGDAAGSSLKLL
jgi:hypothetical protein